MKLVGYLSTVVICNSQAVQEAILAYSPRATTCVLYPVIDSASITRPRRRVGDRLRATLVGRLSESKGQTTAIRAVAAARQAGVEVELTLVGPGNPEPFVGLARRLGVSDLVNIYGPTVNVGQYWEKSDVGLMCSKCEAFGRVTLEAMSAGLPVCGTTSGGTPELIQPGVNGFLSPPGDFKGLAENLMSLARDEDLRLRLGRTASDSVSRFCRARFDQELLRVLSLC